MFKIGVAVLHWSGALLESDIIALVLCAMGTECVFFFSVTDYKCVLTPACRMPALCLYWIKHKSCVLRGGEGGNRNTWYSLPLCCARVPGSSTSFQPMRACCKWQMSWLMQLCQNLLVPCPIWETICMLCNWVVPATCCGVYHKRWRKLVTHKHPQLPEASHEFLSLSSDLDFRLSAIEMMPPHQGLRGMHLYSTSQFDVPLPRRWAWAGGFD